MSAEGTCSNLFCVGNCAECVHMRDLNNAYEKGLREAVEWTPTSEALPEPGIDVLLSLRDGDISTGFISIVRDYFYVDGISEHYIDKTNVLAWQYLPQPYKEED